MKTLVSIDNHDNSDMDNEWMSYVTKHENLVSQLAQSLYQTAHKSSSAMRAAISWNRRQK